MFGSIAGTQAPIMESDTIGGVNCESKTGQRAILGGGRDRRQRRRRRGRRRRRALRGGLPYGDHGFLSRETSTPTRPDTPSPPSATL